jgi:hypothetical protein
MSVIKVSGFGKLSFKDKNFSELHYIKHMGQGCMYAKQM